MPAPWQLLLIAVRSPVIVANAVIANPDIAAIIVLHCAIAAIKKSKLRGASEGACNEGTWRRRGQKGRNVATFSLCRGLTPYHSTLTPEVPVLLVSDKAKLLTC